MEKHPGPPDPTPKRVIHLPTAGNANPYGNVSANDDVPTVMPEIGARLGPHIVQDAIGEGGSAAVFKVWHSELETVRAVKVLKHGNRGDARERFFTEAKILADIRHPNIVAIYDIGYTERQKAPYLTLEYVEGVSVKALLAAHGAMPCAAALSIAFFLCQALHYAHKKSYTLYGKVYNGLIHRDIKPENILVTRLGDVKLMDFGIARPSEVSLHTVAGKVMGTLVYLSPEQLAGGALDRKSDIFSLGAVLYEMLTGARAFPQKTLTELVQKKTAGQYRPLASHGIRFPHRLTRLVDRAMNLEPKGRYANAADMAYDVYGVLKEISDQPPQDVLEEYMKDPKSMKAEQKSAGLTGSGAGAGSGSGDDKPAFAMPAWAIIAITAAGVAITGIVAMLLIR